MHSPSANVVSIAVGGLAGGPMLNCHASRVVLDIGYGRFLALITMFAYYAALLPIPCLRTSSVLPPHVFPFVRDIK